MMITMIMNDNDDDDCTFFYYDTGSDENVKDNDIIMIMITT